MTARRDDVEIRRLRAIVDADPVDLFAADGQLKPVSLLTPEQAAMVSVVDRVADDGVVETVTTINLGDKAGALEQLAWHVGLLPGPRRKAIDSRKGLADGA